MLLWGAQAIEIAATQSKTCLRRFQVRAEPVLSLSKDGLRFVLPRIYPRRDFEMHSLPVYNLTCG